VLNGSSGNLICISIRILSSFCLGPKQYHKSPPGPDE